MSLLVILCIWIAVSVLCAPIVGYFLAGRRTSGRQAESDCGLDLHSKTRPRA
jgi:hypothetical protein